MTLVEMNKETNPCIGCDCYDADMGCTMSSIDRAYACLLEADKKRYGITIHQMADILYNMSLDMDYMDYQEHWEKEICRIENELEMLSAIDSVLFHALEMIAFSNMNYLGLLTKGSE